jgi:hypothetical protein
MLTPYPLHFRVLDRPKHRTEHLRLLRKVQIVRTRLSVDGDPLRGESRVSLLCHPICEVINQPLSMDTGFRMTTIFFMVRTECLHFLIFH